MGRSGKPWLPIATAAGLLTLGFAWLAVVLYTRTEQEVVEKHSQSQQVLARLVATTLAHRIDNYFHRVQHLVAPLPRGPESAWNQALASLPALTRGGTVFLLYPDGAFRFRERHRNQAALEAAALPWLGVQEPVLSNPFPSGEKDNEVAFLVPVRGKRQTTVQVGFTHPFLPLVDALLGPSGQPTYLNLVLLDEQGEVLANTRHPEMTGRRVPQRGGSCLPCHTGFDLERRIISTPGGIGQLRVGKEPLALAAFSRVEVAGRRWSLTLTEPYSAVTAETRRGFRSITLLLGVSLLVGIAAIALTLQYRVQRKRAEERAELAERRAAIEQQLRQSEQLAAIGKMTSQIAHQINTPLAALGLNVAYLCSDVASRLGTRSPEIEGVSAAIAEEIDRLKRLVNDYLRFARLPQPVLEAQSLPELVESFLEFIESEARERRVRLEADLGTEPALALVDADLLRQAFLNLVRNSFDAMPEGGTLRVRLRVGNGEVLFELEDTGRGIPPDALPRIFDPFFTTKKDGTGLGLTHVRRVVQEHGGTIACASRPGAGTTFVIHLPAAAGVLADKEPLLNKKG